MTIYIIERRLPGGTFIPDEAGSAFLTEQDAVRCIHEWHKMGADQVFRIVRYASLNEVN